MTDELNFTKDRKQLLKEKRELKMLERFQYEEKEKSLRESTRKIINQGNYYTGLIKGQPKIVDLEEGYVPKKGKKRGRKPKGVNKKAKGQEIPKEKGKRGRKKGSGSDKKQESAARFLCLRNFMCEEVEVNSRSALNNDCYSVSISKGKNISNNFDLNLSNVSNSDNNFAFENNFKNGINGDLSLEYQNDANLAKNQSDDINLENEDTKGFTSKIIPESEIMREKLEKEYSREVEKFKSLSSNGSNNVGSDYASHIGLKSKTFINCDLRFFNFDLITSRIGYFDVVMIDPPWRIKGGQRNDSSFMFSNSKFNLEYNTLSNNEIVSLPVEKLSKKGFCFLWILNSLMNVGYECLNKWGYDVVDQITWVKTRNEKLYISQGYYFLHSSETCIVGYKCPPNERVEYKSKIATNIMFGNVRGKSQKPEEIYELIEKMMPGSKKIELFARNNNLREGWLSLGNQLGENYHSWKNIVVCDNCKKNIDLGIKRYKSKLIPNFDICQKCYELHFKKTGSNEFNENGVNINGFDNNHSCNPKIQLEEATLNGHKFNNFFEIKNNIDEDILHQYYSCNNCNSEPIWGNRFHCSTCENFDLCESCFDKEILNETNKESPHVLVHDFKCFEVPELANGMSTHNDYRCKFCFQKPIIGPCFECIDCKNYTVCQNCYFNSSFIDDKHFNINSDHKFTIQIKTKNKLSKYVKCFGCSKEPIEKIRFKCNNCFDFNLCELCYKDRLTKEFLASSHKNYHTFTAFYL